MEKKYLGYQNPNGNPLRRKLHRTFYSQKGRCTNSKNKMYPWYGAKGITQEYSLQEFISFVMPKAPTNMPLNKWSIGRIDHSKNYSLDNIEIQTRSENSKERILRAGVPIKRRPVVVEHQDGSITVFRSQDLAAKFWKCTPRTIFVVANKITKKSKINAVWLEDYAIR